MWLRKITKIKSIGRFRKGGVSGGEYAKYTLFYGGNGRGKTTLCSVLRSLERADPTLIVERHTFASTEKQEIHLLLDSGTVTFSSDKWSAQHSDMHIFDQQYISENIHGGDHVDVDQRRNLYLIAIGAKGVSLTRDIESLDTKATAKQSEIASEKKVLQQHVPDGMTVEKFLSLPNDTKVEEKIAAAQSELKALKNFDELQKKPLLAAIAIPTVEDNYSSLIAKTLEGISADATAKVQAQLQKHSFHDAGEQWISRGLDHATQACPFCAQDIAGNELVEAYKGYFSVEYSTFKNALEELRLSTSIELSDAADVKISSGFAVAQRDLNFWKEYLPEGPGLPPLPDDWESLLTQLRLVALSCIDAKIASPLETPASLQDFQGALEAWQTVVGSIEECNSSISTLNSLIQSLKSSAGKRPLATVEAELAQLNAIKKRHSSPVPALAANFSQLNNDKKTLVAEKDAKKKELDAYDEDVLAGYEAEINGFLKQFGTSFTLTNSTKTYVGKLPQSTYCIKFGDAEIDVAGKGALGEPSFRTTMSAGDKSTLALAFFLAQINRDSEIGKKLVVFDDPFSSLDDFRREMTAKNIVRVGRMASQVVVFSHDKYFLNSIRQKIHGELCATMQISCISGNSSIEPWDIQREVKEGYLQDHMALMDFVEGKTNDAKSMRMIMRPMLEMYIRYRFPNQIADGMWLGDMLGIIKSDPSHPLTGLYDELDDINQFTAPFHHDPNTQFNPDEVMTHAKRTLAIIGGS